MWELLQRFRALDSEARKIFFRAAALLPVIALSLRIRGFRATQTSLLRYLPRPNHSPQEQPTISKNDLDHCRLTARMVDAATRHAWLSSTCLEKSLVVWWLLARQGIGSQLRIGARKVDAKFEAHAWVECEGVAISEPQDGHRHYAPFDEALSAVPEARP
jgi:hypothetical protein